MPLPPTFVAERRRGRALRVLLGLAWVIVVSRADDLEFFEKRIRPLFAERCQECHGPKKQEGGLRLDHAAGWTRGGDSGPAWVAGDPESSRLILAVRRSDPDFRMPPKHPLPAAEVTLLEEWVRRGAPVPRESILTTTPPGSRTNHWAYQPVRAVSVPVVRQLGWAETSVDAFILGDLEGRGIPPAADADPRVLARRLHFALIGLPPSPEALARFVRAAERDRAAAVAEWVDELLASPRYGERWARHWFDVVRFAESVTLRGFVFPEAWRYRDYVIAAFNNDLPFAQFVREQVAGDLLGGDSVEERQRRLVATTFLALGNTNLEEQDKRQLDLDVVDEQLDVLGKVFLGQALGCARCHDHKFDPIPTRDYYALAGILASTRLLEHANVSKWVERPLPLPEAEESAVRAHEEEGERLTARIKTLKGELDQLTAAWDSAPSVSARELPGIVLDDSSATAVGDWRTSTHQRPFIESGYRHDDNAAKGTKTLTFHPGIAVSGAYEVRFAYPHGENRAESVPVTVFSADGEATFRINQRERPTIEGRFVSLGRHRFEAGGAGFVLVSNEGTLGHVVADAVQFLPLESAAAGGPAPAEKNSAPMSAPSNSGQVAALQQQLKDAEAARREWLGAGIRRPRVMAPSESKPVDLPIHRRGSVHTLGPVVPRGVLTEAFTTAVDPIPADSSGRRQLADWLASPGNPLTARVFVNRVWHWLFGAGLVRSVDNFGTTGEAPSHPELLDHLARRFLEEGGSVKWLVREIVRSRTYQQSGGEAASASIDPENRWLGHFPRRRLEAECLRDAMLAASGELDLAVPAGPTFDPKREADYGFAATNTWRSVRLPVFRNALPEMLTLFDLADPSRVVGARDQSIVAPQALFLMNNAFVRERARVTAQRWLDLSMNEADRLNWGYESLLGRRPTAAERTLAEQHLQRAITAGEGWADLIHALFGSPDFRYVD